MLTMLGIIIGVGAVITMVALGSGAQKAVKDRIAALGANVFTVIRRPGAGRRHRITDRTMLSTDDYEALLRDAPLLKAVVPEMQQSLQVKYGNQNSNVERHRDHGRTTLDVRNYTDPRRPDVHRRRRRGPPALRGARLRGTGDARRQSGRHDPPDDLRSVAFPSRSSAF